jgi:allantoinase
MLKPHGAPTWGKKRGKAHENLPAYDKVIRGGRILARDSLDEAVVCISDGKIRAIESTSSSPQASEYIEAHEMILLPGLIDSHVHFRDPGLTNKEDFASGTRGAAAGGVTTVFDMPTTLPVVTKKELFQEKLGIIGPKALVDYALFGAASLGNLDSISDLAEMGSIAFKTYTVSPPKERAKEYEGSYVTNSGELLEVIQRVSNTGLVHCIHAEDDSTIGCLTERMRTEGRKDPLAHYDSRPNFTEAEAVSSALILAEAVGARVHFVHVSTLEAVNLIKEAKKRGRAKVSAETCPHYLLFTKEILKEKGPYAKYNPPARNSEDTAALVGAVNDGTIDMVVTDHAPHTKEEKELGREDIFKAPPGTPGVETRLPLLMTMAAQNRIPLGSISRMTSESVARTFGLYPRKGAIAVGSDADIAIVDPKADWKIRGSELQTKAWETVIFDGMEVKGKVKYTLVRGHVAYEDGVGFGKLGSGKFVRGRSATLH